MATEPVATEAQSIFDSRFTLTLIPKDHQIVLSSTFGDQVFVRLAIDDMPTACALSHSDTTLFVGTATGRLVMINICHAVSNRNVYEACLMRLLSFAVSNESIKGAHHNERREGVGRIRCILQAQRAVY